MRKFTSNEQYDVSEQHESGKHETSWATSSIKKPDYTVEILNKLAKSSPEFADKLFSRLKACNNAKCKRNSIIEYAGMSKRTCGSSIVFEWLPSEFRDVRRVVTIASEVVKAADERK